MSIPQADSIGKARILQFGGGNFLRGFFDWMVSILNEQTDFEGSVTVVKPTASGTYADLRAQDGKFHTVLTWADLSGTTRKEVRLIDCIDCVIHPYLEFEKYLESAADQDIKIIVSNTTESGIAFSKEDTHVDVCAQEFPGKLTQWMYRRFQILGSTKASGCLILPCELIADNGQTLRDCVLSYAHHWKLESAFVDWIIHHNQFCNTLVDRIISGRPTDTLLGEVQSDFQFEDTLSVAGEKYHQWIIQGDPKLHARLPFDQSDLNVHIVNDLHLHRQLKVRILNGLHTAMVPMGILRGHHSVDQVMQDPALSAFLRDMLYSEILPTCAEAPDREAYAEAILDRFRNQEMNHQLSSIALNSIAKFRVRLLPTLQDYFERHQRLPHKVVHAFASLIVFYRGKWQDRPMPLNDSKEILQYFRYAWRSFERNDLTVAAFISNILSKNDYWGTNLNNLPGLHDRLTEAIKSIVHYGKILED